MAYIPFSSFTALLVIAFFTWYIKESYASIQTKISKFQRHFRILRFCKIEILHHLDELKIDITRLILKIHDSNFTCKSDFYKRKSHILASRSKDHFLIDLNRKFSKKIFCGHPFRRARGGGGEE